MTTVISSAGDLIPSSQDVSDVLMYVLVLL